jgi:hypothetical protein
LALDDDGEWLMILDSGKARVWDVSTGRPVGPVLRHGTFSARADKRGQFQ